MTETSFLNRASEPISHFSFSILGGGRLYGYLTPAKLGRDYKWLHCSQMTRTGSGLPIMDWVTSGGECLDLHSQMQTPTQERGLGWAPRLSLSSRCEGS